jgi:hypothetical protein
MSFVSAALAKYRHLMPIYETDKDRVSAVLHMIAVFQSAPPGDDAALLGAYLDDLNKTYPAGTAIHFRPGALLGRRRLVGTITSEFRIEDHQPVVQIDGATEITLSRIEAIPVKLADLPDTERAEIRGILDEAKEIAGGSSDD